MTTEPAGTASIRCAGLDGKLIGRGGVVAYSLPERLVGLLFVLALHMSALYGLWSARLIPSPEEAATLFVNFIAPPLPPRVEPPKHRPTPPKPRAIEKPQPRQLVAETPVTASTDYVAPPPTVKPEPVQAPVMAAPVIQTPPPAGPVALSSELSVACPQRSAPSYPSTSRRLGEAGAVVLQVELSETGRVAMARVQSSSGFDRLDEAALAAVRTWHCTPPTRQGQPVRAKALQPFNFVIQGN
jgi:protein TonB